MSEQGRTNANTSAVIPNAQTSPFTVISWFSEFKLSGAIHLKASELE